MGASSKSEPWPPRKKLAQLARYEGGQKSCQLAYLDNTYANIARKWLRGEHSPIYTNIADPYGCAGGVAAATRT